MKTNYLLCKETSPTPLDFEKLTPITINDFEEKSVSELYKDFYKLHQNPDVTVIPVIVNSYGGSVYELLAMIDILSHSSKPIATIGMGKAMSAGSVLLASGTKGYRFASGNIDIMLHEVSSVTYGKNTDIKNDAKSTDKLNKLLLHKLAHYAGKKNDFFIDMIKKNGNADLYLSAKQAKKYGLIDHIGIPTLMER